MASKGIPKPYKSKFEWRVGTNIAKLGHPVIYEAEKFKFTIPVKQGLCLGCSGNKTAKWSTYSPDFQIHKYAYIEAKGKLTSANRTRLKAFKERYPHVSIFILFQRDNWLTKKHVTKYSTWAKDSGFSYHVGDTPPTQWFA